MQTLFQSSFLQALGFAIANSLWQTALVWLVFMCVNGLSLPAAVKYRFAVAAQLTSFIWFIITLQFYYTQYSHAWQQAAFVPAAQSIEPLAPVGSGLSSQLIQWMVKGEQLLPFVSVAYLLLMVFLCIRWFLGYRHTQFIRNHGLQKIPVDWRLFVRRIAEQLGIKKEIRIYLSEAITTPMTIGFLKPIILVPVASINHLSTEQLEAVLLHELAHIKRYDYVVNMVLSVVEISLFFNPFTQLLSKSIRKERENSCDDWVLQFQYNATEYAEALLRIAYLQSAPVFAMAAAGKKNDLLVRVKRMIEKKENRFNYRKQLLAFVIVTGMLSSIAWLNPVNSPHKETASLQKETPAQKSRQRVTVEPMAMKVDNPLFNPVFFLSEPLKSELKKNMEVAHEEMIAMHQSMPDTKELAASIPPMVADAMEKASFELKEKELDWDKAFGKIDFAKWHLENGFKFDTASWPRNFRFPVKEEFEKSIKNAQKGFEKAKLEMNKALKSNTAIHFERQKIEKDIQAAMNDLKKMDLEKLVNSALDMPLQLLSNDKQPQHTKKQRAKEAEHMDHFPSPPMPDKETPGFSEDMVPRTNIDINGDYEDIAALFTPAVLAKLASLPNTEEVKNALGKILRIKNIVERLKVKPKMIPVVFKERQAEENKMVIRLR
jgi:bla regulator protein BlaR1